LRTASRIRQFATQLTDVGSRDPLADGLLDSLALEQLISYLESEFGIEFADEDLVRENFTSVEQVAALVEAKQRASA
jgi:acyl carrier protein